MFELVQMEIQSRLLIALLSGLAPCLVASPVFAQADNPNSQDDAEILNNRCPLSIDYLMIGNLAANTESRFNALVRLLNSSSECNYALNSKASQISSLLDEAYENSTIEIGGEEQANNEVGEVSLTAEESVFETIYRGGLDPTGPTGEISSPFRRPRICDNEYIARIWGRCQ